MTATDCERQGILQSQPYYCDTRKINSRLLHCLYLFQTCVGISNVDKQNKPKGHTLTYHSNAINSAFSLMIGVWWFWLVSHHGSGSLKFEGTLSSLFDMITDRKQNRHIDDDVASIKSTRMILFYFFFAFQGWCRVGSSNYRDRAPTARCSVGVDCERILSTLLTGYLIFR